MDWMNEYKTTCILRAKGSVQGVEVQAGYKQNVPEMSAGFHIFQ